MSVGVDHVRQEWEESHRRLEGEARDSVRYELLLEQVDAVTAELRRRVGQTFTLAELADAYTGAEEWVREAVVERVPPREARVGVGDAALVLDAAFGHYARGATDYTP